MQEVDAQRRIQILRGERPSTPPPPPPSHSPSDPATRQERMPIDEASRYRKRRRIAGEDDTDRDIRFAREDAEQSTAKREELAMASRRSKTETEAPLLDSAGHINLFPQEGSNKKAEKNKEASADAEKQKRSYEDQYTMRFSNAAGFKESVSRQPWYSSSGQTVAAPEAMPEKNVWGNEDPRRKEREKARMDSNDPLAAMKRGVRQLKATEQERKRWNQEKEKELDALKLEEKDRSRHRRRRSTSADSLDDFRLDAPANKGERKHRRHTHQHHHRRHRHHHSRERSRDHERDRGHDQSHRRSHHSQRHSYRRHSDETRPESGNLRGPR